MTVDVKENSSPDELLEGFKTRYQKILDENKSLSNKIRDNETTALKLLGAIETLEYSLSTYTRSKDRGSTRNTSISRVASYLRYK